MNAHPARLVFMLCWSHLAAACGAEVIGRGEPRVPEENDPARPEEPAPEELEPGESPGGTGGAALSEPRPDAAAGEEPPAPRPSPPDAAADLSSADAARAMDAAVSDTRPGRVEDAMTAQGGCQGTRLCEDFEAHPLGTAPGRGWTVMTSGGGSVAIDDARAWSGRRSVRFRGPTGSSRAWIIHGAPTLPVPGNDVHGRLMLYLTRSPMGEVHWNNICAFGRLPSGTNQAYCYGGHWQQFIANYRPQNDCWSRRSRILFPTATWTCLQWQFNGPRNELRMWMDGAPIDEMTVARFGDGCHTGGTRTEWVAPVFDSLRLGWENYQSSPIPIEMWIDDVAVGAQPIACPPVRR